MPRVRSLVLAVLALALPISATQAADDPGMMKRFVPGLLPSVVTILTKSMRKDAPKEDALQAKASNLDEGFGTGFVVDPQGYIVTNRHVVDNAYDIVVTFADGVRLSATVVGKGRSYDLALIKVNPTVPLQAVRLGDSDKIDVGDPVLAIGNPFGLGIAVSSGIVSGLNRDLHFSHFDEFIQTDATINHGNSGGPLFNAKGEVIGITTAIYTKSGGGSIGIGYAIPITDARELLPVLKTFGYLRVGSLEVDPQPVTASLANALGVDEHGVIIAAVDPAGPAAGKLRIGDIIRKIGSDDIQRPRDLYRRVGRELGHPLTLTIWRSGRTLTVDVTPIQAPEEAGQAPAKMSMPVAQASQSMRLGAEVAPLTAENRMHFDLAADQTGILVTKVEPNSPSAAAGLSVGDVIETVQMEPVSTPADGARLIDRATADGRRFIVGLVKGSKDKHFVTVPLSAP